MATLGELDSVYGTQDVLDMLEILSVDLHNRRAIAARQKPEA